SVVRFNNPMLVPRRRFLRLISAAPAAVAATGAKGYRVYFGTYTRKGSKGIYVSRMDAATGRLSEAQLAGEIANPNTLAIHPNGRFLYSVTDSGGGAQGSVAAFSLDRSSGKLTLINQVSSQGVQPIHLAIDGGGLALAVANYTSGSVAAI